MPSRFLPAFVATVLMGISSAGVLPAAAAPNEFAHIALHISDPVSKNPCSLPGLSYTNIKASQPVLSTPAGPFYYVYPVICLGDDSVGIGGVEFGIDYDGGFAPSGATPIDVFAWQLCGDLEFFSTGWPAPGGGTIITWTEARCLHQDDQPPYILAVAGYFYTGAYGSSQMTITPRPITGFLKVASCSGQETDLTNALPPRGGIAGFGTQQGLGCFHPPIPVEATTWGRIKSQLD